VTANSNLTRHGFYSVRNESVTDPKS